MDVLFGNICESMIHLQNDFYVEKTVIDYIYICFMLFYIQHVNSVIYVILLIFFVHFKDFLFFFFLQFSFIKNATKLYSHPLHVVELVHANTVSLAFSEDFMLIKV